VESVTSGGTGTAQVGNLTATSTGTGTYELTDGSEEPVLEGCAVVVTVNDLEVGAPNTAQAAATGPHAITVLTYSGSSLAAEAFSVMVTCP
jgi:hypothetical protein